VGAKYQISLFESWKKRERKKREKEREKKREKKKRINYTL
jgi:hypothetical protein